MSGSSAGILGFAALLVAGLALEIVSRRRPGAPTAGQALSAAMRTTRGRVVVLAAWVWLGVHFIAR